MKTLSLIIILLSGSSIFAAAPVATISGVSGTVYAKEGQVFSGETSTFDGPVGPYTNNTYTYEWTASNAPSFAKYHGPRFPWLFETPGDYSVTLRVTDELGQTDTDTMNVTVVALPQTGAVTNVTDSGNSATNKTNLQNALTAAACGDAIQLPSNFVAKGPIIFPNKNCTSATYIQLRWANYASLPNRRVGPSDMTSAPKVLYPSNDGYGTFPPGALQLAASSDHFWVRGVQFTQQDTTTTQGTGLIEVGNGDGSVQDTLAEVPEHIILDQIYIYDQSPTMVGPKRAISLQSGRTTILNSHIEGGLETNATGQDGQGIASWNGPGPYFLVNNLVQGVSENIAFGGSTPGITNLVAQDILIRRSYLRRPESWNESSPSWDGVQRNVKNYFELKSAKYVYFTENYMDNLYLDRQSGYGCLNITVRGDSGGWATVQYVDVQWNHIFHGPEVMRLMLKDRDAASVLGHDVYLEQNLFDAIVPGTNGTGRIAVIPYGSTGVVFNHNTLLSTASGAFLPIDKKGNPLLPAENSYAYIITNNAIHGNLSVADSSQGTPLQNFNFYFTGSTFERNMVQGGASGDWPVSTNYYPAAWTTEFVNYNGGSGGNYALKSTSTGYHNATDGTDVGVNTVNLAAATLGCVSGNWAILTPAVMGGTIVIQGGVRLAP